MKIYIVSYTSNVCDDLYNEVKVEKSKDKAQEVFDEYIKGITEDIHDEKTISDIMSYVGKDRMDFGDYMNGNSWYVQINCEEI